MQEGIDNGMGWMIRCCRDRMTSELVLCVLLSDVLSGGKRDTRVSSSRSL